MLNDKLLALRKHAGLSQQEVAAALDVTRQTISNWETGQAAPALDKAIALAALYRIGLDDLARDEVEVVVGREGIAPAKRRDLHVLKRAIGKQCKLVCADADWMLYGHPGGTVTILDANEDWVRISYRRRKEANPLKTETAVQLLDTSSIYTVSILGDLESEEAETPEEGDR